MKYSNIQDSLKKSSKGKYIKILGYFFITTAVFGFCIFIFNLISWNSKKNDYTRQYAYNNSGNLQYELENQIIQVKTIYDSSGEEIKLDISNNQMVMLYCNNIEVENCIYFDLNNSFDLGIVNPFPFVFVILFSFAMGLYIILTFKCDKHSLMPIYCVDLFLFLVGISCIIYASVGISHYLSLKKQNNVTTAVIYSKLYSLNSERYKSIAYYYVDEKKYIYVNEFYEEGILDDVLNDTFELYYDDNDYNNVCRKEFNNSYIIFLFSGIFFTILSFRIVFFRKQSEEKIKRIELNQN